MNKQIVITADDIEDVFGFIMNELNNADIYTTMRLEDVDRLKQQNERLLKSLYRVTHPAADDEDLEFALQVIDEIKGEQA